MILWSDLHGVAVAAVALLSGEPFDESAQNRARRRAGAATGESRHLGWRELETGGALGGQSQGGECRRRGGQAGGDREVGGYLDLGSIGEAGELADDIEERLEAVGLGAIRRRAIHEDAVRPASRPEGDGRFGGEAAESDGNAAGVGKVEGFVSLAPVLRQRHVGIRCRHRLRHRH